MSLEVFNHSISPAKVLRGESAWEEGLKFIQKLCKEPLFLGRSDSTRNIRKLMQEDLINIGLNTTFAELKNDCCEDDIKGISNIVNLNKCDGIIAAGGGKVLDAGKLIADRLSLPCITVPLSAATCAGWTSLSNIYTPDGAFIQDFNLKKCPDLLIFDHGFVRQAPARTLASGIADALAKWYEASLTSSSSKDGLVQQAVQMSRVLRDQLLLDGLNAFKDPQSDAWERVAEACALSAGLIGGIGGARCRTAAAHPIHNGLTQLEFHSKPLHGELVAIGIIIQLNLEEENSTNQLAKQAKSQLIKFLKSINVPVSIKAIGLKNLKKDQLIKACKYACKSDSDIHQIPFEINERTLLNALTNSNNILSINKISKNS